MRISHGITIGQLAAYAGVTIKAVRHYHRRGLLAEPPRDSSGYRRYTPEHAIELVKIKTLADAGVPLARIKELLSADTERFAAAIAEIDRRLQQRADELARARERIACLTAGDRPFVSAELADFLDQLRELGVSQRAVHRERDLWILLQSVSPEQAAVWLAEKRQAMEDPEFRAVYRETDAAFDWSPDDPRLYAVAERSVRWLASRQRGDNGPQQSTQLQDAAVVQFLATAAGASSPAWERLGEIAREFRARATGAPGASVRT